MGRKKSLDLTGPKLFKPSDIRKLLVSGRSAKKTNFENIEAGTTSSFRYDSFGEGIKSSQQLNIDFSKFENHTFFNSAVVNTNIAFDKIINYYPFDGSKLEREAYEDRLSGFEKHILNTWPRSKGYLNFGSNSYVKVEDMSGIVNPALSRDDSGAARLDPKVRSLSIECHVLIPAGNHGSRILCQKISADKSFGFTIGIEDHKTNSSKLIYMINSGSAVLNSSMIIKKGRFEHIAAVLNREESRNKISLYRNAKLITTSSQRADFGSLGSAFTAADFLIGSGTSVVTSSHTSTFQKFVPGATLTGSIDEFRIHHKVLNLDDITKNQLKEIDQNEDLALYFRFNEPTGSLGTDSSLVLDYSGNSLHSKIQNFDHALRSTGSVENPMKAEDKHASPVLFPGFSDVLKKNRDLLVTASAYDNINPNLITKLVPQHYFDEGQYQQGLESVDGSITGSYKGGNQPGSGELGTFQLLSAFLYVYAKHFDELKTKIDAFANILTADYHDEDTVPDQFLPFLLNHYGFDAPNMFSKSSIDQYVFGRDLKNDSSISSEGLQKIQAKIWRQVLTNLTSVIKSKGTLSSVKSILRSVGIDPDTSLRIREYGGSSRRALSGSRISRKAITGMINFSGSINTAQGTLNAQGVSPNRPFLVSPFFSGSRVEPGYPYPQGSWTKNKDGSNSGTNKANDGLQTSGSWSFEGIFRFPQRMTGSMMVTQSLARLAVTGTTAPSTTNAMVMNLVLVSGSEVTGSRLTLHGRPGTGLTTSDSGFFELSITGTEILNGDMWWISFGRERNDRIQVPGSSSYFLRAASANLGKINTNKLYMTSSFFKEANNQVTGSVFSQVSAYNTSGSFLTIGSQSLSRTSRFLHADVSGNTQKTAEIHATNFMGQVSGIRFWSKALALDEWQEHVRNYRSLGVRNPAVNFNFVTTISGSFEKLRMDVSAEQSTTSSNANRGITFFDYSQHYNHLTGTGFEMSASLIKPVDIYYTHLSTKIDELTTDNKIRPRGFKDYKKALENNAQIAPVYALDKSEEPLDDPRFSVDFSVVDALDEDIIKIFGTLEFLDNAIGNPELIFSSDYPALDHLRNVYFDRLTGEINHKKFFEFFKWFDSTLGSFISNVIPRKTSFLGTNFVIESHMLERPKIEYYSNKQYLGEIDRRGLKGTITLTQYTGDVKKF
ncbi:LamG domain-containing protein [bacterium]|nr:LamG domain-containing protein [bacterium]